MHTFCFSKKSSMHGALNASLYRPGSQPITDTFFTQLGDVLERCSKYSQCYVIGDLNVHLDDKTSSHTIRMQQLLTDFGLHDCVRQPTHTGDHQLDVFVTRDGCEPWSVEVQPPMLSNHSLIIVIVDTQAPAATLPRPFVCRRRRWAAFCLDDFISELNQSLWRSIHRPTLTTCLRTMTTQ